MSSSTKAEYSKIAIHEEDEPRSTSSSSTIVAPNIVTLSPTVKAALPIACYCFASILMTVTNKYVVSGYGFNMNFLLLTVQVSFFK